MNTKIEYLYRDGSNYQTWEEIVLTGELTEAQVTAVFASANNESGSPLFLPQQVGMESLLGIMGDGTITEADHPWHELFKVTPTTDRECRPPNGCFTAAMWAEDFIGRTWDIDGATKAMEDLPQHSDADDEG